MLPLGNSKAGLAKGRRLAHAGKHLIVSWQGQAGQCHADPRIHPFYPFLVLSSFSVAALRLHSALLRAAGAQRRTAGRAPPRGSPPGGRSRG